MNRRFFLKALSASVGAAVVSRYIPEVPELPVVDYTATSGWVVGQTSFAAITPAMTRVWGRDLWGAARNSQFLDDLAVARRHVTALGPDPSLALDLDYVTLRYATKDARDYFLTRTGLNSLS